METMTCSATQTRSKRMPKLPKIPKYTIPLIKEFSADTKPMIINKIFAKSPTATREPMVLKLPPSFIYILNTHSITYGNGTICHFHRVFLFRFYNIFLLGNINMIDRLHRLRRCVLDE